MKIWPFDLPPGQARRGDRRARSLSATFSIRIRSKGVLLAWNRSAPQRVTTWPSQSRATPAGTCPLAIAHRPRLGTLRHHVARGDDPARQRRVLCPPQGRKPHSPLCQRAALHPLRLPPRRRGQRRRHHHSWTYPGPAASAKPARSVPLCRHATICPSPPTTPPVYSP